MNSTFQEKDYLQDMLVLEKDIVKYYGGYIIEASCPKLRTILNDNMQSAANDQFGIFNTMNEKGYYPTKAAPVTEINQAKTKFQGILSNLN